MGAWKPGLVVKLHRYGTRRRRIPDPRRDYAAVQVSHGKRHDPRRQAQILPARAARSGRRTTQVSRQLLEGLTIPGFASNRSVPLKYGKLFSSKMNDYDQQKWFDLYTTALLELERAAMTGRIDHARAEISVRLEALKQHPGLHKTEYQAIQDALTNLRALEREEARLVAEDKKRLLQESARKLQSIAPMFQSPGQQ
jgi:hypothetical protein